MWSFCEINAVSGHAQVDQKTMPRIWELWNLFTVSHIAFRFFHCFLPLLFPIAIAISIEIAIHIATHIAIALPGCIFTLAAANAIKGEEQLAEILQTRLNNNRIRVAPLAASV